MTVRSGDALFGQDGTDAGSLAAGPMDVVGPLPGFDLPVVRLPVIGPDGGLTGLDSAPTLPASTPDGPSQVSAAVLPVPEVVSPGVVSRAPGPGPGSFRPGAEPPARRAASQPRVTGVPVPPTSRPGPPITAAIWPGPPWPPPPQGRPGRIPGPVARPRVIDEPGILGLSRRSRSRLGSRLFTLFFVLVFALILVQMVAALLDPQVH